MRNTLQIIIWNNQGSETNEIIFVPVTHSKYTKFVESLKYQDKVLVYKKDVTMEVSYLQ